MDIQFKCHSCNSEEVEEMSNHSNFSISSYNSEVIQFSEEQQNIPTQKHWIPSEDSPIKNETRNIFVEHPFKANIGDSFWTYFMPNSTMFNDLEKEHDINRCAFLKGKVLKILSKDEYSAWLQIEVMEQISLSNVHNVIEAKKESSTIFDEIYGLTDCSLDSIGDWLYYNGTAQGDINESMLLKKIDGKIHLIMLEESAFHRKFAYLGNIIISDETYKRLLLCKDF